MPKKTYKTLQELTGHEAGAIRYPDGAVWIGNWTQIAGIPRFFAGMRIGLGEILTARRIQTPSTSIEAMWKHEQVQGEKPSTSGWKSWTVRNSQDEYIVTINDNWN